jgi:hypothetical protein
MTEVEQQLWYRSQLAQSKVSPRKIDKETERNADEDVH